MIPPNLDASRPPGAPAPPLPARSAALYAHELARVDVRHVLRALGDRPPAVLGVGDDSFRIVWTSCDFGGRHPGRLRPWVLCRCGRRVGVLYSPPGSPRFACRSCWGLRYLSDDLKPAARRRRRAWLLRARLGDSVDFETYAVTGFRPVPPRPRGMRRDVYEGLAAELRRLEGADDGESRSGRPRGMHEAAYRAALDRMARAPDGGTLEAAVANLSRVRLAARRASRRVGAI